jgi:hypothetical protein
MGVHVMACMVAAAFDGGVSAISRGDPGFDDTIPGAAAWIDHFGGRSMR